MTTEHVDVLIVGAGLSGIGAACRLQQHHADRSYAILESRQDMGGTWDLFRYPGIRSDSDMKTFAYPFRPWAGARTLGSGHQIAGYIKDTAREHGVDRHIRYGHRVLSASWSTPTSRWTVEVDTPAGRRTFSCCWLLSCAGYYRYDAGHAPDFAGREDFAGDVIHPQFWPEGYDVTGKRVVVIGSGATAVTLVPNLAERAEHVTMLQRSPTYIVSTPTVDPLAEKLHRRLPARLANGIVRWRNIVRGEAMYRLCRRNPTKAAALIKQGIAAALPDFDRYEAHFTPKYDPWDQRLCMVPDGDLFRALGSGRASIVTAGTERFTATGVMTSTGEEIPADVVVTATGLRLQACGGIPLIVDGRSIDLGGTFLYKGVLLGGVPNFGMWLGYVNASWTLRADVSSRYLCRVLSHMDEHGYTKAMPVPDRAMSPRPVLDLTSGYVTRAADTFPKLGDRGPWRRSNYIADSLQGRFSDVTEAMAFSTAARPSLLLDTPADAQALAIAG